VTQLSYTTFKPLLHQKFKVKLPEVRPELKDVPGFCESTELDIELVEITEKNRDTHDSFSLIFRGPEDTLLPQKSYAVQNDALGTEYIFLVAIGESFEGEGDSARKTGYLYQAVFSCLKKKDEASS